MEKLRDLERRPLSIEKGLLIALVSVMVVLSFLQVVLRGAFSFGLLWADTFLRHLVLWVGFLGASVAASADKQFAMDAMARVLKGRVRAALTGLTHLFTAVVCAFLTCASWTFFRYEYEAGGVLFTVAGLEVPPWVFETILPAGFLLLAVHYLIKTLISTLELRKP